MNDGPGSSLQPSSATRPLRAAGGPVLSLPRSLHLVPRPLAIGATKAAGASPARQAGASQISGRRLYVVYRRPEHSPS